MVLKFNQKKFTILRFLPSHLPERKLSAYFMRSLDDNIQLMLPNDFPSKKLVLNYATAYVKSSGLTVSTGRARFYYCEVLTGPKMVIFGGFNWSKLGLPHLIRQNHSLNSNFVADNFTRLVAVRKKLLLRAALWAALG